MFPESCLFCHDPELMIRGEGENSDVMVNWALHLELYLWLRSFLTTTDHLPILFSTLPSLGTKTPRYLTLLHSRQELPINLEREISFVSGWEPLHTTCMCQILFQTLYIWMYTLPKHIECPGLIKPVEQQNLLKAEIKFCCPQIRLFGPWLCLKILLIKNKQIKK